MIITIYAIKNVINNKMYIGQTAQNPIKRFKDHLYKLKNKKHASKLFINDYFFYGLDKFILIELEQIKDNELLADEKERYYINEYDTINNGYNIALGGKKGKSVNNSTKQILSIINSGENHPNFGKHLTNETRQKISNSNKGRQFSEEQRQNMSKGQKGISKPISEETKKKLSILNKGKKLSEETKRKIGEASKKKISKELEDNIITLLKQKISTRKISEILNCSRGIVLRIQKENKIR